MYILIQYLIFAGYLRNDDVSIQSFYNNGRTKRAAVGLTDKGCRVLEYPGAEPIMIPLIILPSLLGGQHSSLGWFGVDKQGKLIEPTYNDVLRDWHTPHPRNRPHGFSLSDNGLEATAEEQVRLDFFDRLDEGCNNLGENGNTKTPFRQTSHFNFDRELLRYCKKNCYCRQQLYRKNLSDKKTIYHNADQLMSQVCFII